jgi:hypothetical protein
MIMSLKKDKTLIKKFNLSKKKKWSQVLVAHACNPSYSGGKDQEDCGSKPAWANSSWDPILKKTITEKG